MKVYFASDFHLGINATKTSQEREQQLVRWLTKIKEDAEGIYLVGDLFFGLNISEQYLRVMFDFWES